MPKVSKSVEVSKEASELADALVKVVASAKEALKDGFQVGQDLPAVVVANMGDLLKGIEGVDQLDEELKEDASAFVRAWALAGSDVAGLWLKKEEQA